MCLWDVYEQLHKQTFNMGEYYDWLVHNPYLIDQPFFFPNFKQYTPPYLIKSVGVSDNRGNKKKLLKLMTKASSSSLLP